MATSPNDVRVQVIMKIREEMDMEVTLEEEMELLVRLTGVDMRNAMQMMGARHELQRSLAEKVVMITNYRQMKNVDLLGLVL
ncbi:hypothetical protein Tco_1575124 [Tanacetum coccineum]